MATERSFEYQAIFGEFEPGLSVEDIAKQSNRRFVRGKAQIAVYDPTGEPTGHILTAWEAYQAFGLETLAEAVEYGSGIILRNKTAIEDALRSRREGLGLTAPAVARATKLPPDEITRAETDAAGSSIQSLERIACVLGLDESRLAYDSTAGADAELAVRLKTLLSPTALSDGVKLSEATIMLLAEASSIVRIQYKLQNGLRLADATSKFAPTADYGSPNNPAWQIGYRLAGQTRVQLSLGQQPIPSMRELTEETLGIPVIQTELQPGIAGATVAVIDSSGIERRGIVLNIRGQNNNVWVRRATLAHEIGHLLFDPMNELQKVRVDSYDGNNADPEEDSDSYVEQRANAFAIAFLAPNDSVRRLASPPVSGEAIAQVMSHYGVSLTAALYHVSNVNYRQYETPSSQDVPDTRPTYEWRAAEDFAVDYFPIGETPIQRRGRFAGVVARASEQGLISEHTAAAYLCCEVEDFKQSASALMGLYPIAAGV